MRAPTQGASGTRRYRYDIRFYYLITCLVACQYHCRYILTRSIVVCARRVALSERVSVVISGVSALFALTVGVVWLSLMSFGDLEKFGL